MATFNQVLASIIRSGNSIRSSVQKAVIMAIEHYGQHGDTCHLTKLYTTTKKVKAINTSKLVGFIREHANVKLSKLENGDQVFKKDGKEVEVKPVTSNWYDFEKEEKEKTIEVDVEKRIKSLLTTLEKAIEGEEAKIKDGQEETARKVLESIQGLLG